MFGADCEVLTVVDAGGRPVSSVLSFYFRDEVLPYYAGDDVAARDLAANDFKYWELMRRACERGLKVFDYGRSKQGTGSFAFKKNWGFEPQPLHYEYRLYRGEAIPQNNPMNPKYRALDRAVAPVAAAASPMSSVRIWREASVDGTGMPMESLLFLVHRLPFPPNKGDKVRSFHFLKHLAARYRVFLGTFVDDPADWQHVEALRGLCARRCTSRRSSALDEAGAQRRGSAARAKR